MPKRITASSPFRFTTLFATFASLAMFVGTVFGQTKLTEHTIQLDEGKTGSGRIADVGWLEGYWIGEGLGGTAEEMWSPAVNGSMTGTFRLWEKDKLNFSEFFVLEQVGETLVLKLKHFDEKFKGWEKQDKFVEFKLVKIEGKTAWFDGLTYQVDDKGNLHAFVAIRQKDKSVFEGEFVFKPKKQ